jgi:hypothetical protein
MYYGTSELHSCGTSELFLGRKGLIAWAMFYKWFGLNALKYQKEIRYSWYILETIYDHQGFRYWVWILYPMGGGRGYAWYRGKYVTFDYIQIVCNQKCCHEK